MNNEKLALWQERLTTNRTALGKELEAMERREKQYSGINLIEKVAKDDFKERTNHVRNLSSELIESQINSNIPQPKVTPLYQEDEHLAKLIEDMLRNELDRMPFEEMNDAMERIVPVQGAAALLVEWDNAQKTHTTTGEINVSIIHPKQLIAQAGVYSDIEKMDYLIIEIAQTKEYIRKKYGISVESENEGSKETDIVTQCIAYYRNDNGGIGIYSWVGDTELEDMEDYQARTLRKCKTCGAVEDLSNNLEPLDKPTMDGSYPEDAKPMTAKKGVCKYCGGKKWTKSKEEFEEVYADITTSAGTHIPKGTKIPFYSPNIYPVMLQRNVSVHGKLFGESDLDKIKDQQNTTNRLSAKILDKLFSGGSYMTLPDQAEIKQDGDDLKRIVLENPADKHMIDVYNMQPDISKDLTYLAQVYEEGRQIIGITDSFQGRKDATATSGKAKEFAAAQSAGRLESKRIMKNAMYARLFEAIFKFKLAYTDEARPVLANDFTGKALYSEFNRYDFLKQDVAGEWYWNDRFIFSCDTSAPLANNREAMWQETRLNLQTGAFGNPQDINTLILFWSRMERLHYPLAGETKRYLEEMREQQMQMQQEQMQMQMEQEQILRQIDEQARISAERDYMQSLGKGV